MRSHSLLILWALFFPIVLFSQNKTGNIVEYFGKEKINNISEGSLLHMFDEGLVLELNTQNNRSATFPPNPLARDFLINPDNEVKKGDSFGVDYLGREMKWETITTDSTHTFSDRKLRSGYLYLEYNSPRQQTVLFEGSGQTQVIINGMPHEGDHYDFGYSLLPVTLQKGKNIFLLTPGRFPRMRARLIQPSTNVLLTLRDTTLPDLLKETPGSYTGAVRVINSTNHSMNDYTIECTLNGVSKQTGIRNISPLRVVKIPFQIPYATSTKAGDQELQIDLLNEKGRIVSTVKTAIEVKSMADHHKKTFISDIDGSLQYYSVAPGGNYSQQNQALFLSVHGASVEAVNQANAYDKKEWGTLVAPTNRRPFGYAWEDWGRIDAMEVLKDAKQIYDPDPQKIYLTGHSMGGHGTWYLGATYPDRFAAIAPCAGYPDLLSYRDSFRKRIEENPALAKEWGISDEQLKRMLRKDSPTAIEQMIERAGNPSRTLKLKRNYLQQGVYILHGEKDNVVPTFIARDMREKMGTFHNDFTYYEYPDGTHWYGDHSVDWPPIFEFFKRRSIPKSTEIDEFEFYTASPGVSSGSHFAEIYQQIKPLEISSIRVNREDSLLQIDTENVEVLSINRAKLGQMPDILLIDDQEVSLENKTEKIFYQNQKDNWKPVKEPSFSAKGPHRNGGFKDAFTNNVVLVYATGGDEETNNWYYNRAVFDAEKFWYRGNGDIPIIKDTEFITEQFKGRNIVLYGNSDNNAAWQKLLSHSPVQVTNNQIQVGDVSVSGNDWGTYFIYPKPEDTASVGVVSATGKPGAIAAFDNNYLQNGTMFPDFVLFNSTVLTNGVAGVKCAGFFGNDWQIDSGEFAWQ